MTLHTLHTFVVKIVPRQNMAAIFFSTPSLFSMDLLVSYIVLYQIKCGCSSLKFHLCSFSLFWKKMVFFMTVDFFEKSQLDTPDTCLCRKSLEIFSICCVGELIPIIFMYKLLYFSHITCQNFCIKKCSK